MAMRILLTLLTGLLLPAATAAQTPDTTTSPAGEPRLVIEQCYVERGDIIAALRLIDAFDADARRSLKQGLPITLRFSLEIWRERNNWFDKQIDSRVRSYRIRYHPGERSFGLVERGRADRRRAYETLEQVLTEVSRQDLPVYPRWELDDGKQYFITAEVAVQPLTLSEFRELDGWISGRIRGDGTSAGDTGDDEEEGGGITGAIFDLLVDLSGFGDEIHRDRTPRFRPPELPTRGEPAGGASVDDLD